MRKNEHKRQIGKQAKKLAGSIEKASRKEKIDKALTSFGKWVQREKSSVDIVNDMRKEK